MQFPETIAGRNVTNRGVHLLPAAYHGFWMQRASYWIELLVSMHMSWVVIISDGDSVLEQCETDAYGRISPLELLLAHGIIPLVRDGTDPLPRPFTNMEAVRRAAPIYGEHGLRPMWIVANEPFDGREWKGKPPDAHDREKFAWVMGLLQERMARVVENGGIAGFPDGPCYPENPFRHLYRGMWDDGLAFYATHNYGKGRPVDYPYDVVSQIGEPWDEPWREELDRLI